MATEPRKLDGMEEGRPTPDREPAPLADRRRPGSLEEIVGQEHLTGPGAPLRGFFEQGRIPSLILWGPPGSGKTTLARILGSNPQFAYEQFSAVLAGVKEVRAVVERARERRSSSGRRTILFVDEIHRFNRTQQDAFLPHVESGLFVLIGATTENPSFEVNGALLSRCRTYVLRPLTSAALRRIGERAVEAVAAETGGAIEVGDDAWEALIGLSDGDARRLLNLLEAALAQGTARQQRLERALVLQVAQQALPTRQGDEDHFDWISALHKSLRGSDPHAGLYWLSRMLEAGEDPKFIVRRLIVFASEDVGLADPGALVYATAAMQAIAFVGMPECALALSELVLYLALAPKSNSAYVSYRRASDLVRREGALPVPLRLRNAPTGLMQELGYGEGYRYPHDVEGRWVPESYLPDRLSGRAIYRSSSFGREGRLVEEHLRRTGDFYRVRPEADAATGKPSDSPIPKEASGPDHRAEPTGSSPTPAP